MKGKGPDESDDKAKKHIGTVNPIDDFKAMISDRKTDRVESAIHQMRDVIERYVRGSVAGDIYGKAIECLLELRQACVSEDEAPFFNKFLEQIKHKYASGNHAGFWKLI